MMKEKVKKRNRISDYNLTILFIIIIFSIPILVKIKPHRDVSIFENRTLATPPVCNKETLLSGEYFSGWEEYLSDHIVGRNTFLKTYTYFNLNILKKNKINDVVIGKDGTLLPFFSHPMMYNYDIETHKSDIKAMVDDIVQLDDHIKNNGGKFCFVGIPGQNTYYKEKYPDHFFNNEQYFANSEKMMFTLLGENDINYVNMNEEFKKQSENDYYFKTDHHYAFEGAFKTYQEIINKVKDDLGYNIQGALDKSDMDIVTLENPIIGSRNRQLYYVYPTDEKIQVAYPKEKVDYKKVDNGVESPKFYHIDEDPNERPSYGVFMGGDLAETVINTDRPNLPNALIFGDSFTNAVEPLLYYHFDETRILDLRHYEEMNLYEYIERYKPDVVIMMRDNSHYDKKVGNGDFTSSKNETND